jgi:hypothetical protein
LKVFILIRAGAFLLKSIQQRGFIVRKLLFEGYAMKTPLVRNAKSGRDDVDKLFKMPK